MGEPTLTPAALELERQKIELERYKAGLNYRRTIIVSGFVAVAIALIPPLFQAATALIDYFKFQYQLSLEQANKEADRKRDVIVNFFDRGANQDIEVRLRLAEYFKFLAQGDRDYKKNWDDYYEALKTKRTTVQADVDRMERELAKMQSLPKPSRNYVEEDRLIEKITWRRGEVGYIAPDRSVVRDPRLPEPAAVAATATSTAAQIDCANPAARINFDAKAIPSGRRDMAELIAAAFAKEGYGVCQQAAAVAAGIQWSRLDPRATPVRGVPPEVGLYQLGPRFGSAEQLLDPAYNTAQVIKLANEVPSFRSASTLTDAVAIFVRRIMRPAPGLERIAEQVAWARELVE